MKRTMVLDTETTGISTVQGDRLIEVGIIDITGNSITNNYFHDYYNPEIDIKPEVTAIHGYSNEFINDFGTFKNYGMDFLEFVTGHDIIIHRASFDVEFINNEIKLAFPNEELLHERCNIIDSLSISKLLFPNERQSIRSLKKKFEIDSSLYDEYQPALYSAVETAEVYLNLIKEISARKEMLDFYTHILKRAELIS